MGVIELQVPDMTCEHCVRAVSARVADVAGVTAVEVDLPARTVRVSGIAAPERVRAAVAHAGHRVAP
ncbi:heavy-metal-associated domain-containing protein [Pseudonocardia sp. RS11V-5]|uniref:heavy-metal-associated domain-containing protein n=1 Tax=Pseudonocardia terrae TaxID=2905831 RepID=UPI001E5126FE|nr:heavy-metal-associated domain-containing protein [Pseudonocardia terrae]MCE3555559.1 heavy-metal-associated domain-containing protein [Pseudonocardia terrae]